MTAVLERFDASAGSAVPLQISGIAVLIGIVVLAIGLVRGRRAPVWVALGLVAGILMNLLGFASGSLVLLDASGLVLLVAMAEPARRILSQAPLKNR
jgi:threonine/homoserine/homoserine lactone efflux protein